MHVYELNEKDRGSPAYLPFSFKFDFFKFLPKGALGDLVPFTNKVTYIVNIYNNSILHADPCLYGGHYLAPKHYMCTCQIWHKF